MWPWGHAAVAYVAWSAYARGRHGRPPTTAEAWTVLLGSQFPDLVDKPLAWQYGVLPSGRSLAHSGLTLAVLALLAKRLGRWPSPPGRPTLTSAFLFALATHLPTDAVGPILRGEFHYLGYVAWPLASAGYEPGPSLLMRLDAISIWDLVGYQGVVVVLCVLLWLADGAPGIPRPPFRRSTDS